ncbi:unnamed protein product [Urochloa decumbens]|uniref:Myb/SANT-like domain-containing protein n=1 Tax=Urochloa decumbens TaxID=240449 RepID=A0ABC8WI71_9POAL
MDDFSQENSAGNSWPASRHGNPQAAGGFEDFDLNSQAADEFPHLDEYGAFLQGRGLPPQPPLRAPRSLGVPNQRAGSDFGWAGRAPQSARHLNFGASSSSAAAVGRQRANTAATAPVSTSTRRRPARSNPSLPGGGGRGRGSRPPVPRNGGINIGGSGQSFNDDEELPDVDDFGSVGGLPVSQGTRAFWSDENNACLLQLAVEQRRAGTYSGAQMSAEGYRAVIQGLKDRRRLVHDRDQVRNQLRTLKKVYSFWCYLEKHTGLGRKPDGSVDAESDWWKTHTEKQPYLKKLQFGPPSNLDLLQLLFSDVVVDGSSAFVPGDDFGEGADGDEGEEEAQEEERIVTPRTTSSQRSKRSAGSLTSTLNSPVKKIKSPMVRYVKDIATTFKESVNVNTKQMQKRVEQKEAFSVKNCQDLGWACGIEPTGRAVLAMSKLFASEYQRQFFCGLPTPQLRLSYFKEWCRDNNME